MNLTTLAVAEAWLQVATDNGGPVDAGVNRMISAASSAILGFLDRAYLASRSYTETRNGSSTQTLMLRQWPVTSIKTLALGGIIVPPGVYPGDGAAYLTPGYLFEEWDGSLPGHQCALNLRGYGFGRGLQNVSVSYTAGYLTSNEPWTIQTSPLTITPLQIDGAWGSDAGVTFADTNVALVKVNGTPTEGQYSVSSLGVYTFAAADAERPVLISYGFIPSVIAQCCLDAIQLLSVSQTLNPFLKSEKYDQVSFSYNTTLGSIAGVAPGNSLFNPTITAVLQPYRRVMSMA